MIERDLASEKARDFFEKLWKQGDPWQFENSRFERQRYARLLAAIENRRYGRTLEIGCGAGAFTRILAAISDNVVGMDISSAAIARAQAIGSGTADVGGTGNVEYRVANVMDYDPCSEEPWDLVVLTETIYYLGWLYPFFDVGWLASRLFTSSSIGGRLLLANTQGNCDDALLLPWLIKTYRDLFVNVGYLLETEEVFRGTKDGVPLEVLVSLFIKPS